MDKCTFCGGGPEADNCEAGFQRYCRNRLAEGKLPLGAEMCAIKARSAAKAAGPGSSLYSQAPWS
jgi:hypothetical protein